MDWIESIIMRTNQAQERYETKRDEHNKKIDLELSELDAIVKDDLAPGMLLAKAQRAIMLSQIRLLRKQWENLRME